MELVLVVDRRCPKRLEYELAGEVHKKSSQI